MDRHGMQWDTLSQEMMLLPLSLYVLGLIPVWDIDAPMARAAL